MAKGQSKKVNNFDSSNFAEKYLNYRTPSKRIEATIRQISDPRKLDSLMDYVIDSRTLEEFEAALK